MPSPFWSDLPPNVQLAHLPAALAAQNSNLSCHFMTGLPSERGARHRVGINRWCTCRVDDLCAGRQASGCASRLLLCYLHRCRSCKWCTCFVGASLQPCSGDHSCDVGSLGAHARQMELCHLEVGKWQAHHSAAPGDLVCGASAFCADHANACVDLPDQVENEHLCSWD
jgi:hypothetical protein